MTTFDYYLLIINAVGFVAFLMNHLLYKYTETAHIDPLITILALAGGSPGIIIGILIFERNPIKDNMMSRVFVACVFVIELIAFLAIKGFIAKKLTFAFWTFFSDHKWLLYYLIVINVVALIMFAIDKINAVEHRNRIRIVSLLGIAFVGGSVGSLLAMYLFHHKTKKDYFSVGVPLIMVMQIILVFYLMNIK